MRLVEVNGAGWYLQLVSNRRGPGHLIICLLIARRRTYRSCREEARAENKTQRSHARQEAASTGCRRAGTSWERMLWAMLGPPMYLGSPWRPAAAAPPRPLPAPHPTGRPRAGREPLPRARARAASLRTASTSAPPVLAPSLPPGWLQCAAGRRRQGQRGAPLRAPEGGAGRGTWTEGMG